MRKLAIRRDTRLLIFLLALLTLYAFTIASQPEYLPPPLDEISAARNSKPSSAYACQFIYIEQAIQAMRPSYRAAQYLAFLIFLLLYLSISRKARLIWRVFCAGVPAAHPHTSVIAVFLGGHAPPALA